MKNRWREDRILISALVIAAVQTAVAVIAMPLVLATADRGAINFQLLFSAHVVVFAAAGTYLLSTGWSDDRVRSLGTLFLLVATSFSSNVLDPPQIRSEQLRRLADAVLVVPVGAFTAYFFWRFASAFPRAPESTRALRWFKGMQRGTLALGFVFATSGILEHFGVLPAPLRVVAPGTDVSLVFAVQGFLILVGLVVVAQRTRRAPLDERRRASLLLWGIAVGVSPMLVWQVLVPIIPSLMRREGAGWLIYPAFMSMAISVPYAVVGKQALDVSVVVRRAVHYTISRFLAGAVLVVAPVALLILILRHRNEALAATLSGDDGVVVLVLVVLSILAYLQRARVMHMVDRAFFRERYDAERIKAGLEQSLVEAVTPELLAQSVNETVSRALHPTHCEILLLEESEQRLTDPLGAVPALGDASRFTAVLSRSRSGLTTPLLER
ncbi:MAG TPA: hypothetical protein VH277_10360, partial [Gemmatimonadaceae bacterium]|nr:hypothetical protein [Gemmatimonadaceae bacterium]